MDLLCPTKWKSRHLPICCRFSRLQNQEPPTPYPVFYCDLSWHCICTWAVEYILQKLVRKRSQMCHHVRWTFLPPTLFGYIWFLNHGGEWKLPSKAVLGRWREKHIEKWLELWWTHKSGAGEYLWRNGHKELNISCMTPFGLKNLHLTGDSNYVLAFKASMIKHT